MPRVQREGELLLLLSAEEVGVSERPFVVDVHRMWREGDRLAASLGVGRTQVPEVQRGEDVITEEALWDTVVASRGRDSLPLLVLADWLEEYDDERCHGIRALGYLKKFPTVNTGGFYSWFKYGRLVISDTLTEEWFSLLGPKKNITYSFITKKLSVYPYCYDVGWADFMTAREAIHEAAVAFHFLSPEQQAAILQNVERPV